MCSLKSHLQLFSGKSFCSPTATTVLKKQHSYRKGLRGEGGDSYPYGGGGTHTRMGEGGDSYPYGGWGTHTVLGGGHSYSKEFFLKLFNLDLIFCLLGSLSF